MGGRFGRRGALQKAAYGENRMLHTRFPETQLQDHTAPEVAFADTLKQVGGVAAIKVESPATAGGIKLDNRDGMLDRSLARMLQDVTVAFATSVGAPEAAWLRFVAFDFADPARIVSCRSVRKELIETDLHVTHPVRTLRDPFRPDGLGACSSHMVSRRAWSRLAQERAFTRHRVGDTEVCCIFIEQLWPAYQLDMCEAIDQSPVENVHGVFGRIAAVPWGYAEIDVSTSPGSGCPSDCRDQSSSR